MKKISIFDIILSVLSVVLFFGTIFIFHACPAKDDGTWMVCHWAEHGVIAFSVVLSIVSLIRFFIGDKKIKMGLSISIVPCAIFTALIPGVFINLCMMKNMRCHTVMRPAVIVLCVLITVSALVDLFIQFKNTKRSAA